MKYFQWNEKLRTKNNNLKNKNNKINRNHQNLLAHFPLESVTQRGFFW